MNYPKLQLSSTLFTSLLLLLITGSSFAASNTLTLTAKSTPTNASGTSDTIIVHKPTTDPTWGKVIQYQQEEAISATDHTKETLHKFLFQDSNGIVRLATYHESLAGNGYWEVWVWDQP